MKYLFLLFVFSSIVSANELPQTVNEAAKVVYKQMKEQDKIQMVLTPESKLVGYNRFFGAGIRNSFGLWGNENTALLSDCVEYSGHSHPEACSGVIIRIVWDKLKKEYSDSPLNKTFEAITTTLIPPYYDKNKGIIKYVEYVNEALSVNPKAKGLVIRAECDNKHYRIKDYVNEYRNTNETSVLGFLVYLSVRGQGIASVTIKENEIVLKPLPFLNSPTCEIDKS